MQMNLMSSMKVAAPVMPGIQRPALEGAIAVRQDSEGIDAAQRLSALDDPAYPGECGFAFAELLAALLGRDIPAQPAQGRVDAGQEPAVGAQPAHQRVTQGQSAVELPQQSVEQPASGEARADAAPEAIDPVARGVTPEPQHDKQEALRPEGAARSRRTGLQRLAAGEIGSEAARKHNPQLKGTQPAVETPGDNQVSAAVPLAQRADPVGAGLPAAAVEELIAASQTRVSQADRARAQLPQSSSGVQDQLAGAGVKIEQAQSGGISFARLAAGNQVERLPERAFLQIKQIAAHIGENIGKGVSEMKIQLQPEHLGGMTVKVSFASDQVNLAMRTETVYAKQMLEANFTQLREALAEHGIGVGSFDVGLQDGAGSSREQRERFSRRKDVPDGSTIEQPAAVRPQPHLSRGRSSLIVDYFA